MAINVSNKDAQEANLFIGGTAGALTFGFSADDTGSTVFAGVGGGVSQELKAITGSNILSVGELGDVMEALLTSGGKRGEANGVDGVELTSLLGSSAVLEFTANNGAVDTMVINLADGLTWEDVLDGPGIGKSNAGDAKSSYAVIDTDGGKNGKGESITGTAFIGKADKDYHVGGFARGEQDVETLLAAALDEEFDVVSLVSIDAESFTIEIHRGAATDTYTFIGSDAVSAIDEVADNPFRNMLTDDANEYVIVTPEDSNFGFNTGRDASADIKSYFGNVLTTDELIDFVADGETAEGVEVSDIGSAFEVTVTVGAGTDTFILSDDLFIA